MMHSETINLQVLQQSKEEPEGAGGDEPDGENLDDSRTEANQKRLKHMSDI